MQTCIFQRIHVYMKNTENKSLINFFDDFTVNRNNTEQQEKVP